MRAHLDHLPTAAWVLLGLPVLLLAYRIIVIAVPVVVRSVVPETVRAVLHIL